MVVVGLKADRRSIGGGVDSGRWGGDGEGVGVVAEVVFDADADFGQFGDECLDAVAFFVAEGADASDDGGAFGEGGNSSEGHHGVGHRGHIRQNASKRCRSSTGEGVAFGNQCAAHLFEQEWEPGIALE